MFNHTKPFETRFFLQNEIRRKVLYFKQHPYSKLFPNLDPLTLTKLKLLVFLLKFLVTSRRFESLKFNWLIKVSELLLKISDNKQQTRSKTQTQTQLNF